MLRAGIEPEHFHRRQVGTLPGQYGLRVTEIAEGRFCGELELRPWMWAPNGYLHAASVIVLADSCAGYATVAHLPEGAKGFIFSILPPSSSFTRKRSRISARLRMLPSGA